jgi:hypothetical protein
MVGVAADDPTHVVISEVQVPASVGGYTTSEGAPLLVSLPTLQVGALAVVCALAAVPAQGGALYAAVSVSDAVTADWAATSALVAAGLVPASAVDPSGGVGGSGYVVAQGGALQVLQSAPGCLAWMVPDTYYHGQASFAFTAQLADAPAASAPLLTSPPAWVGVNVTFVPQAPVTPNAGAGSLQVTGVVDVAMLVNLPAVDPQQQTLTFYIYTTQDNTVRLAAICHSMHADEMGTHCAPSLTLPSLHAPGFVDVC